MAVLLLKTNKTKNADIIISYKTSITAKNKRISITAKNKRYPPPILSKYYGHRKGALDL